MAASVKWLESRIDDSGVLRLYDSSLKTCPRVPPDLATRITGIDFSENCIRNLTGISALPHLDTIVLDRNQLSELPELPRLPLITTLFFNNNKLNDLAKFISALQITFPNLKYLSMMRNPSCPGLNGTGKGETEQNRVYRLRVISRLPHLVQLDGSDVAPRERAAASALQSSSCRSRMMSGRGPMGRGTSTPTSRADARRGGGGVAGGPRCRVKSQSYLTVGHQPAPKADIGMLCEGATAASEGNRYIQDQDL